MQEVNRHRNHRNVLLRPPPFNSYRLLKTFNCLKCAEAFFDDLPNITGVAWILQDSWASLAFTHNGVASCRRIPAKFSKFKALVYSPPTVLPQWPRRLELCL